MRTFGVAALATLLSACGGGGGDSGGSGTPGGGGNNPPPSTELQPITLGPQSYQDSVQAVGPLLDLTTFLGKLSAAAYSLRESMTGTTQYTSPCPTSGQITIDLVDNNANQHPSAGDRVVVRYANCVAEDVTTNAVLNIDIASLSDPLTPRVIDLRLAIDSFSVSANGVTMTVTGGVNNLWTWRPGIDRFMLTGTRLSTSSGRRRPERLENFSIDWSQDYSTYEYSLTWRGDVASEQLGGTFRFDTDVPLLGQLGLYPEVGAWTLYGEHSSVRLEEGGGGESFSTEVGIVNDFDGDGVFVPGGSLMWLNAFDMTMFDSFRQVTVPSDLPSLRDMKGRVVTLTSQDYIDAISDIVVDPSRGMLYASSPINNEIVAVSTATYHVTDRIPVGAAPRDLYLPTDRSELMVVLNRGGAVGRVNPDTRQFYRMETAEANNTSAPQTIVGVGDAIYVTAFPARTRQGTLPTYYARGTRSTNTATRLSETLVPTPNVMMAVSSDGRYLYTTEQVGNDSHFVKRDLSQPDAPIVSSRVFTYQSQQRFALNPDDQTLVLTSGEVLRTSDFAQVATVSNHSVVAFNDDGSRMLALIAHQVVLYDAQRYITLRTLIPDCSIPGSQPKLAYVAANDQWVAQYGGRLCVISTSDRLNAPGQPDGPTPPAPLTPVSLPATYQGVFTPLNQNGATIQAAEIDRQRGVLYLGGRQNMGGAAAVVSLADLSTVAMLPLPAIWEPLSIAMNDARDRIYVNQDGDGYRLEVIDTTTDSLLAPLVYPTDLFGSGYGLNSALWIGNDRLLMTTRSNGDRVTMATLDVNTAMGTRIAGGEARFTPGLRPIISADRTTAFTTGFTNELGGFLERIDLTLPDPAVVKSRAEEGFNLNEFATLSPDGEKLYYSSGNVVSARTLMMVGYTAEGMQIPAPDGSVVYVVDRTRETLSVIDARTYKLRALYSTPGCFGQTTFAQLGLDAHDLVWTAGAGVCRVTVP